MKNAISAFALIFVLSFPASIALADTAPVDGVNPQAISMPWGLTAGQTAQVPAGTVFFDEGGIAYSCPSWFNAGCFDTTRTNHYRATMRIQAKAFAAAGSNLFAYWLRH